ncbi:hypothetical protein [Streptomyces chiangmaiensis]|uniref:Uncharacterized protein n=1 Tax=Streptomyces chiangmaiensis TaxID=766497 RepID=A0ABU7FEA0_9ACTN|nr:hypothetical protein [Streptomyces chiangmaiensis]MED7822220.1 hypothetical protein [Streptomyces chiangmaiensis]
MNDTSTSMPLPNEAQEIQGHGRHRGPVSAEDTEAAPSGRHRAADRGVTADHREPASV